MGAKKEPVTQAVRLLRASGVHFEGHPYAYVAGGGTAQTARELEIDEHLVVKTLIMEDENADPLIVLMHGDREVATGLLARAVGASRTRQSHHSAWSLGESTRSRRRGADFQVEAFLR